MMVIFHFRVNGCDGKTGEGRKLRGRGELNDDLRGHVQWEDCREVSLDQEEGRPFFGDKGKDAAMKDAWETLSS